MRPFKILMHLRRFVFFIFIFDHYEIVIILQNLQNCITEFEKINRDIVILLRFERNYIEFHQDITYICYVSVCMFGDGHVYVAYLKLFEKFFKV